MSIIKYYVSCGDDKISEMFTPYVWKEYGLDTVLEKCIQSQKFDSDLYLLLVEYYVEGKFDVNGPEYPKVSNYSKKNKSVSVAFTVRKKMFHDRNEFERREFIVDSTIQAIRLVKEKLSKKKLNIDFDQLLLEIKPAIEKYLTSNHSYSQT